MAETAGALLDESYRVPEEDRASTARRESYPALVARLSRQSVVKHFDAYADIDWDAPDFAIHHDDPRWELGPEDVLGATAWYRSQPQPVRAALGLHMIATFMKIGAQFESVLKRGLLEFAWRLPNNSPEFRYAYHETIEEAQHSLMFQEFVNRTGFDVPGLGPLDRFGSRLVIRFARTFPELFFLFVLGGEDPIDHVQRTALSSGYPVHPLLKRIMQIHVTEEARHLCFARHYLKQNVPKLGAVKRFVLRTRTPIILGIMSQMMMRPSPQIVQRYAIPREVLDEAYRHNPVHKSRTLDALAKVRALCLELGMITRSSQRLWRLFGIWPAQAA